MEPVKTSSFQLPNGKTLEVTFVRLSNGDVVPRAPHEVVARPTPPVAGK